MAVKPTTTVKENVSSAAIINNVTKSAGIQDKVGVAFYDSANPAASLESIRGVGQAIMAYTPYMNAYTNTLVNKIIYSWVTSKVYENPWTVFKKGMFETGDTIEEIFVDMLNPHVYDVEVAEKEVFKREKPNVLAAYHVLNSKTFYKLTIEYDMLKRAFYTINGTREMVAALVQQMYTSMNYDEFQKMKYILAEAMLEGRTHPVTVPEATKENASSIVSTIKGISSAMTFMSDSYTEAGNKNFTLREDQYVILNAKWDAIMSVEVLATAFNMDKVSFMGHVILVDSFGKLDIARLNELFKGDVNYTEFSQDELNELDNYPAVIVDKDFFMIFDALLKFAENYNGQGLYWNYFLHHWQYLSTSPFVNVVSFTTGTPSVTGITVSPSEATYLNNQERVQNVAIDVNVTSQYGADSSVAWTVGTAPSTGDITFNGNTVVIAPGTSGDFSATAVSKFDTTKQATVNFSGIN